MNNIGENVFISEKAKVSNSTLKDYTRVKDYVEVTHSTLGEYSNISQQSLINKTVIQKFTSIGHGSYIGLWEHNREVTTHSFYLYETSGFFVKGYTDYDKDVIETSIGNDVWIGANSIILKGTKIGDGAIIGAGSVVTRNIPPYAIAVGNPAKVIKYRYSQEDIEFFLNLKWWDFSRSKIQEIVNLDLFSSFDKFKNYFKT
jgi:acetyltransferase-like isoleucine patch superfamily enzyme